jgi:hypothetical protein
MTKGRPFKKGEGGRKPGSINKFTSFKNSILQVYQDLGGDAAFCEWAKKSMNQGEFYKMASKLLPKEVEVSGKDGQPLQVNIIRYTDKD